MALRGFCVGLPAEPGLPHHHGAAIRPCAQRVSPCEAEGRGCSAPFCRGAFRGRGGSAQLHAVFQPEPNLKSYCFACCPREEKKSRLKTVVFNLRDRSVWPAAVVSYLCLIVCHRNGGECEV